MIKSQKFHPNNKMSIEGKSIVRKDRFKNLDFPINLMIRNSPTYSKLSNYSTRSKVVRKYNKILNNLSYHKKVNIEWVTGHSHITGNDKADELARKGSAIIRISHEQI